jgi:hypothetical protein
MSISTRPARTCSPRQNCTLLLKDGRHAWEKPTTYNRYLEIARLENSMSIDATTFSYKAELSAVRNQRVLAYCLENLKKDKVINREAMMDGLTEEECLQFALSHTYLEYRDTLHFFTFENSAA